MATRRVGVTWLAGSCNRCERCREGRENLCREATFTGWDRDGGFAELATVRADFAVPLPAEIDDVAAAPLLCGGVIGYRALRVSGIQPGARLGLFGFGASARARSRSPSAGDAKSMSHALGRRARPRDRARRGLGRRLRRRSPPVPLAAAITFAPAGDVVVAALRALDRGGTVAINAIHLDRMPEFPYELLWWERCSAASPTYTRQDAREFLELADGDPDRTEPEPMPLSDGNRALLAIAHGEIAGAAVLAHRLTLPGTTDPLDGGASGEYSRRTRGPWTTDRRSSRRAR